MGRHLATQEEEESALIVGDLPHTPDGKVGVIPHTLYDMSQLDMPADASCTILLLQGTLLQVAFEWTSKVDDLMPSF